VKTYEIVIKPTSGFGTPLVGDTLFGQFCWQIRYGVKGVKVGLEELLADYSSRPFVVISNAYPRFEETTSRVSYAFNRPDIPLLHMLGNIINRVEIYEKKKKLKGCKWMLLNKSFLENGLNESLFISDKELYEYYLNDPESRDSLHMRSYIVHFDQPRNSINRLTCTTGDGGFAPFTVTQNVFAPGAKLAVFAGVDTTRIDIEAVTEALRNIGETGFGKDASTGLGRFEVMGYEEVNFDHPMGADSCYTLGPYVPGDESWDEMFFTPCIRFGRHGGALANASNPFKAPIISAREGAVFRAKNGILPDKPYIGRAVTGISKADPNTVSQGYSLYLPFKMEAN